LRAKVVERIKADYENASKLKLKRALLDVLDKEYSFETPSKLVDAEYDGIVKQYEQAKKYNQLDEEEKAKDEKDLLAEYKGEKTAVREMRGLASWYFKGLPGSHVFKNACSTMDDLQQLKRILDQFKQLLKTA
jgi:tRNA-dihydrouridine synthase